MGTDDGFRTRDSANGDHRRSVAQQPPSAAKGNRREQMPRSTGPYHRTMRDGATLTGPSGMVASLRVPNALLRARGLIGRQEPKPDEGLLLRWCNQIHTFGMKYPIDVIFCDRKGVVLRVSTLPPRRLSRLVPRARYCIELRAGRARECGIDVGTRLEFA